MIENFKKTFLCKKFIIFSIIGFLAYLITQLCFTIYTSFPVLYDDKYHVTSMGLSFVIASVFTYFANAKFTYEAKTTKKTMMKSIFVYIIKFITCEGVTLLCMFLSLRYLTDYSFYFKIVNELLPLLVTCVTMIFQYICFNYIFKGKEEKNNEKNSNNYTRI